MRHLLILISVLALVSCSDDDKVIAVTEASPELIGNWKLVEIHVDPGDGSGDFQPVDSNKTVKFGVENDISSNGSLCSISAESNDPSEGTYSETDQTFTIASCGIAPFTSNYRIVESNLILSYSCFEACQEKYIKIDD